MYQTHTKSLYISDGHIYKDSSSEFDYFRNSLFYLEMAQKWDLNYLNQFVNFGGP